MDLKLIKKELNGQLTDPEILNTLLVTTFKGLSADTAKTAMLEAMMRGFKFEDFLQKNIYAVPFAGKYSLVTSIDYARKVGMRSGVVGKSEPTYEDTLVEGKTKIVSCTITVKRKVGDHIGDYSAKVYFDEYNTGQNQWIKKPRTMIAKVAEMHALRMACPEQLSQAYTEEEYDQDIVKGKLVEEKKEDLVAENKAKLEATTTMDELQAVWKDMPPESKVALKDLKEELKKKYEGPKV